MGNGREPIDSLYSGRVCHYPYINPYTSSAGHYSDGNGHRGNWYDLTIDAVMIGK